MYYCKQHYIWHQKWLKTKMFVQNVKLSKHCIKDEFPRESF